MKPRIIFILLCAFLLAGAVSVCADGGSPDDPLVSLSGVTEDYLPSVFAIMDELLARTAFPASPSAAGQPKQTLLDVPAGSVLRFGTGGSFLLLSGSAELQIQYGCVVNAALGCEISDGPLALRERYIPCEDSSVLIHALTDVSFAATGIPEITRSTGSEIPVVTPELPSPVPDGCPFLDVTPADWFYADVCNAYALGLVNGMTADTYVPLGTLTAGQCVKLAACMHQLWYEGTVTLQNSPAGGPWFRSYVDYALENGILEQEFFDYNAIITRQQFVQVFYRALPSRWYPPINEIDRIPDVDAETDPAAVEVYTFYRAGILTGYSDGSFDSDSTITRAEVAAIMNRMFDFSARRVFEIP